MYIKSQIASLLENRRLLLLVVLLFALVVSVQYFELPYGNAFFSLFYAGKPQFSSVGNFSAVNSSISFSTAKSSGDSNLTSENGLYSTDHTVGITDATKVSNGNDAIGKHSVDSADMDSDSDRNLTSSDGLNSTDHTFGITDATKVSDGNDAIGKHSVDSVNVHSNSDPEDELPSTVFIEPNNTSTPGLGGINNRVPEKASEESDFKSAPDINIVRESAPLSSAENENVDHSTSTSSSTILSSESLPPFQAPEGMGNSARAHIVSDGHNASSSYEDEGHTIPKTGSPGLLKTNPASLLNHSPMNSNHNRNKKYRSSESVVVSLSQMNDLLISNLTSYRAKKPKWTSKSDEELLLARSLIENSPVIDDDSSLHAPLFRNFSMFKRSYELMEQTLKVYIYKEGDRPIFHTSVLKGIYASEGWFMKLLKGNKKFVTKNPEKAHLFYLPFSSRMLEETLYSPDLHSRNNLVQHLNNYLSLIASRYTFWNRTGGADHFLVACHDWAPSETERIMANCIRALCNSDISKEGFQFGKDVALPETSVRSAQHPLKQLGGRAPSQRKILAFFAGRMHGDVRPILLQHWKDKDPDMKIFGKMERVKGQMNYVDHMKNSKYCICAKGYEVNSPRVVEAIFYDCVPVIISDNFVPPFFETFNWESFAVFVPEKDIPNLKNMLVSIPEKKYFELQRNVKLAQQHFLWHFKPVKYDIFHMILHSIWYTRVLQLGSS